MRANNELNPKLRALEKAKKIKQAELTRNYHNEMSEKSSEAARALGLIGASPNINSHALEYSRYDKVQPLLNVSDLLLNLYVESTSKSECRPLTTRFYQVHCDKIRNFVRSQGCYNLIHRFWNGYHPKYYRAVFDEQLATDSNFYAHVIAVMADYNRALAKAHGFPQGLMLTQHHLKRSSDGLLGLEQTAQAKLTAAYHKALDALEDSMAFDELDALMPRNIMDFSYYAAEGFSMFKPISPVGVPAIGDVLSPDHEPELLSPTAEPFEPGKRWGELNSGHFM